MNRSIAWIGVAVIVVGIGMVAFPLVAVGREVLDDEQILGFLLAPVGLFVVLIAAVAVDPRRTTVTGAFGNPDERTRAEPSTETAAVRARPRSPLEPVHCRYCRSVITADLAQCPRCARARDCRPCGRPLGLVLERPTCPTCALAEPYCHCPALSRPAPARIGRRAGGTA